MNFSRSSMGLHTFQGILRPPQKAPLCYPCVRNELLPFSQEGQLTPGHTLGRGFLFAAFAIAQARRVTAAIRREMKRRAAARAIQTAHAA